MTKVSEYVTWQARYAKDYDSILAFHNENIANGNKDWTIPTAISSMPDLREWEAPYVTAFFTLTNSRSIGMSVGPLPISEILAYCKFFDVDDPELFLYLMQRMDNAYLEEHNRQQENKPK